MVEMNRIMYHTQQNRGTTLDGPCLCTRKNAWLGTAYYFWEAEKDAIWWGIVSKGAKFQVYEARIISDKVLDTVFNEEHYNFFIRILEKIANKYVKCTNERPGVEFICEYLNEKTGWKADIDVILINDNPTSSREILPIPLRKRIQAAVYNKECIHNFKLQSSYD